MKNKRKNLKYVIIISIIVIFVLGIFFIKKIHTYDFEDFNSKNEESIKQSEEIINSVYDEVYKNMDKIEEINIKEKLKEEKNINGLIMKNSMLYKEGEIVTFISELYNDSEEDIEYMEKEVILLDINGNELGKLNITIGNVKKHHSSPVVTYTKELKCDIKAVYDFKII